MDIKELKSKIESKKINVGFLIFQYTDIDFLPLQYLHEIRKILNTEIEWIDDFSIALNRKKDIFCFDDTDTILNVLCCDTFDYYSDFLAEQRNLIVICKKIKYETELSQYIINFPKLEIWQIKDYVYSMLQGVEENKLDYFMKLCNNDIQRLSIECEKLKLFTPNEKKYMFDDYMASITDISQYMIFDFTNALLKKDINMICNIYREFQRIDIEPLGVVTLLYNNLKNVIKIQLSPNPTAESCGMKPNQFWAIKKNNCGFYSKEQLMYIFSIITDIDRKLKTGEITTDIMIDYIVCHMFGC